MMAGHTPEGRSSTYLSLDGVMADDVWVFFGLLDVVAVLIEEKFDVVQGEGFLDIGGGGEVGSFHGWRRSPVGVVVAVVVDGEGAALGAGGGEVGGVADEGRRPEEALMMIRRRGGVFFVVVLNHVVLGEYHRGGSAVAHENFVEVVVGIVRELEGPVVVGVYEAVELVPLFDVEGGGEGVVFEHVDSFVEAAPQARRRFGRRPLDFGGGRCGERRRLLDGLQDALAGARVLLEPRPREPSRQADFRAAGDSAADDLRDGVRDELDAPVEGLARSLREVRRRRQPDELLVAQVNLVDAMSLAEVVVRVERPEVDHLQFQMHFEGRQKVLHEVPLRRRPRLQAQVRRSAGMMLGLLHRVVVLTPARLRRRRQRRGRRRRDESRGVGVLLLLLVQWADLGLVLLFLVVDREAAAPTGRRREGSGGGV
mmetsp:Transcript_21561/g.69428  ORF Transcript_21561/g.69428 Transcript_21561/m.69428 type:complete len:425 (+) Transcript_21561:147-1421(+)